MRYSSNGTISGDGNHFGLVDIPKMCLLCVSFGGGTYGLGAISPRKPTFWLSLQSTILRTMLDKQVRSTASLSNHNCQASCTSALKFRKRCASKLDQNYYKCDVFTICSASIQLTDVNVIFLP